MAHSLDGFRLKLNRANAHLETLKAEIEPWFQQHPYGIVGNYQAGPPEKYVFRFRVFDPPPAHWPLLIGEFAHQARSALDHLVWQLVLLNNKKPTTRNQFPILLDGADWKGRHGTGRLLGVDQRHVERIEALQPYHRRTNPADPASIFQAMTDPLSVLSCLNNEDKHRVLVPAIGSVRSLMFSKPKSRDIARDGPSWPENFGEGVFGPLVDGAPLLHFDVKATGPNPEVQVEITEGIHIAIDQRVELADGTSLTRTRIDLKDELEAIVDRLRDIFKVFVTEFG